jgi:hypothetical protein
LVRVITLMILSLAYFCQCIAQHTPDLINYKGTEYRAHNQNWTVSQSKDRWMYFGNTDGLLAFNGNQWTKYPLNNNKIIRSVHCSEDRIYTGAYGEFGYWLRDECGDHQYYSLTHLIADNALEKEEVWHIISEGNDVYFQSFSLLMKYDGRTIKKIPLPGSIMFLSIIDGKKIIPCIEQGIFELSGDNTFMMDGSQFFAQKTVTGITSYPTGSGGLLIATASHGVFCFKDGKVQPWNEKFQNYFMESQVNKSLITKDGLIVIGTIRDGLLIFNPKGSLRYHIQTANGLQNNTILALTQDLDGHLWLGLDKGISHIKMNENILYYKDESGYLGTVYSLARDGNILYVGTNQGVYYYDTSGESNHPQASEFKLVKGTQGQVWELKKIGDVVFCGHNDGTFIIQNTLATKISDVTGGWFIETIPGQEDWLVQGTYTGVIFFKKAGTSWKFSHKLAGYSEPVKKIVYNQDNSFWVTGPNTGLTLLTIDPSFQNVIRSKQYIDYGGIKNFQNTDISVFDGKLVLYDGEKHYYYDVKSDKFIIDTNLQSTNNAFLVRKINDRLSARIYVDSLVIYDDAARLFGFEVSTNRDYHNITTLGEHIIGVCLNEGYAVIHTDEKENIHPSPEIHFSLTWNNDTTCFPISKLGESLDIKYTANSFRVQFYDTEYLTHKHYAYRVSPMDHHWKPIADQDFVDINNLSSGTYDFELKSNNDVYAFRFTILSPWYSSGIAWVGYTLLVILGFWLLKKYFDKQLKFQGIKLERENARILRERVIEMENDRLVQDNITKSKEVANATLHLIQKNELLQEIKEELMQIRKSGDQILTTKDFQVMMKQINDNLTVQDDKNLFNASFEDVHDAFLKKLKSEYPELTGDDLRLAAYLRMNLASKDIAPLFNISIRGMENKRYRLRKKMNLPGDTNLTEFFTDYV